MHGYAGVVLRGATQSAVSVPHTAASTASYLYGAGAVLGALGVAAVGVLRLSSLRTVRPAFAWLRALHSGHVGDYVAWLTTGIAVIGTAFALTLR
jgi:multicomponent Na+:H+ antiporter subunit D